MRIKVYIGSYIQDNREGPNVSFDVPKAWVDTHEGGEHFDICFPFQTDEEMEALRQMLKPLLSLEEVTAKSFLEGVVEVYLPCSWRVVFGE